MKQTTTTTTSTVKHGALANVSPVKRLAIAGMLAIVLLGNAACTNIDKARSDAASKITCGQYADTSNAYNLPGVQRGVGEETGCDTIRDLVAGK